MIQEKVAKRKALVLEQAALVQYLIANALLIAPLVMCLHPGCAQAQSDWIQSSRTPGFSILSAPLLHASQTLADLDGDRQADFALSSPQGVVNGAYRYRVDVYLATGSGTTFDVDSKAPGGLHISARDVDGDHDLDLVITSQFGHEPVGVWINDGHGQFTQDHVGAYAEGIWQEIDHCLETPNTPHRLAQPLVNPAGGWVLQQDQVALLLLSEELHVAADYRALNPLNPGNPFRAPPLS